MENNDKPQSQIVTFEDLAKYTEEVLLPGVEEIIDEKLAPIRHDISDMKTDIVDMKNDIIDMKSDIADIKQELVAIRKELSDIKSRLDRLERATKEDSDAYGADIVDLRERVNKLEIKLAGLENK